MHHVNRTLALLAVLGLLITTLVINVGTSSVSAEEAVPTPTPTPTSTSGDGTNGAGGGNHYGG